MPLNPLPDLLSLGFGAGPPLEEWRRRAYQQIVDQAPVGQAPAPAPVEGLPPPFLMGPPAPLMGPPVPPPQQLPSAQPSGILHQIQRLIQANPASFDQWAQSGQPRPLPPMPTVGSIGPRTSTINYVQTRNPDEMAQPGVIQPGPYRMQQGGFTGVVNPAPDYAPLAGQIPLGAGLPLTSPGMTVGTSQAPATQQAPIGVTAPPPPRPGGFGAPGAVTVNLPSFENPAVRRPVHMNDLGTVYRLGSTMPSEGEQMAQLARQGRYAGAVNMPVAPSVNGGTSPSPAGGSPFQRFLQELGPVERWSVSNPQFINNFYRDLNNSQEAPSLVEHRRGQLELDRARQLGLPGVPGSIQNAADMEARLRSETQYRMSPEARADAVIAGRIAQDPNITPEEIQQIRQAFRAGHVSGGLAPLATLPSPGATPGLPPPGGSPTQPAQPTTPEGPQQLADVPGAVPLGPGNVSQGLTSAYRQFLRTMPNRALATDQQGRQTAMLNFMTTQAFRQALQTDPVAAVRFLQDGLNFGPEAWNTFWNQGVRLPGDNSPTVQAQNEVLRALGGQRMMTYTYIGQVPRPAGLALTLGGANPVFAHMAPQDIESLIREYQARRAGPTPLPQVR